MSASPVSWDKVIMRLSLREQKTSGLLRVGRQRFAAPTTAISRFYLESAVRLNQIRQIRLQRHRQP